MLSNAFSELRILPPIQVLNFLSCGLLTLIGIVLGAKALISLKSLLFMPGNIVLPPARIIFPYRSLLIWISHFKILW